MRFILIGLALIATVAGAVAAPLDPAGTMPAATIDAGSDAWRRLEAEQEERRRRRELAALSQPQAAPSAPAARSPNARPMLVKPARSRMRAEPRVAPRIVRREPPPGVRPVGPRPVRVATALANPRSKVAACYQQVGIQVDAAGQPLSKGFTLSDSRSQDAFIRCVDGR